MNNSQTHKQTSSPNGKEVQCSKCGAFYSRGHWFSSKSPFDQVDALFCSKDTHKPRNLTDEEIAGLRDEGKKFANVARKLQNEIQVLMLRWQDRYVPGLPDWFKHNQFANISWAQLAELHERGLNVKILHCRDPVAKGISILYVDDDIFLFGKKENI